MGGAGMKKPRTEKLVHLLEDLIVEILTRLPSKSLLRFKCVSKRWRLLISGKPFIRRHLKQSSIDPDLSLHHLIARPLPDPSKIWSCPLRSIFDEERPPSNRNLQSMYDESNTFGSCNYLRYLIYGGDGGDGNGRFFMRILGSCNGLILVSGPFPERCCLLVWNPAIRKANTIPAPAPPHEQVQVVGIPLSDYQMKREHYCIGYDECADEYKVVHILITRMVFHDRRQITSCSQTRIYSSRTSSWKEIESSHGAVTRICDYLGKFVNGRLHWMAFEDDDNNYLNRKVVVRDIVCLDLVGEEEKYEIMGGPEYLSIRDGSEPVLKDLGGYLSLICLTSTSEINVSVMMKYGDHRSWTNILTLVDFDQNPTMETNIPRAMPLWLKKNGDMAVYFGPGLVIYNGNYKSHKSPVDTQFNSAIDSVTYVESLVSPFGK